jgi:hypothetical protein
MVEHLVEHSVEHLAQELAQNRDNRTAAANINSRVKTHYLHGRDAGPRPFGLRLAEIIMSFDPGLTDLLRGDR